MTPKSKKFHLKNSIIKKMFCNFVDLSVVPLYYIHFTTFKLFVVNVADKF